MNKKMIAGLATGVVMLGTSSIANALTITYYNDFALWSAAVGTFQTEDFDDTTLLPGLSFTSFSNSVPPTPGYIDDTNDWFYGRPLKGGNDGTTWSFGQNVSALGGTWDFRPGDFGVGLKLVLSGGPDTFTTVELDRTTVGFWGFTVDSYFTTAFITAGTQGGNSYAWETHHLDNLVYNKAGDPVPEPATILLFGAGIAGLAAWRRRTQA